MFAPRPFTTAGVSGPPDVQAIGSTPAALRGADPISLVDRQRAAEALELDRLAAALLSEEMRPRSSASDRDDMVVSHAVGRA
jgi:hypothetical protein